VYVCTHMYMYICVRAHMYSFEKQKQFFKIFRVIFKKLTCLINNSIAYF